jgi:hypothetical protein
MLLYSPDWLFLYPGLVLLVLGLAGGAWLAPGPRRVGSVTFDVHAMLYAALAVILGFQAISFAAFARTFAASEGLLPGDGWHRRVARVLTLEVGALAGLLLLALGLGGSVYEVLSWGEKGFGNLDVTKTLRGVIPSVLAMVLGLQLIMSSFFLSVLGLGVRKLETSSPQEGAPPHLAAPGRR